VGDKLYQVSTPLLLSFYFILFYLFFHLVDYDEKWLFDNLSFGPFTDIGCCNYQVEKGFCHSGFYQITVIFFLSGCNSVANV